MIYILSYFTKKHLECHTAKISYNSAKDTAIKAKNLGGYNIICHKLESDGKREEVFRMKEYKATYNTPDGKRHILTGLILSNQSMESIVVTGLERAGNTSVKYYETPDKHYESRQKREREFRASIVNKK